MKKTKIICTIGPASQDKKTLIAFIKAGMNCARFNFSHGTYESLKLMMDTFKKARKELNEHVPILLDTKGPEIRVKDFVNGSVILKKGQLFTFDDKEDVLGDETRVALTYHDLAKVVKKGTVIMVDDGKIKLKVDAVKGKSVITKVVNGGKISNHKSINVPNVEIPMTFLSKKDKEDLLFGIKQDIDYVAASFTRTKQDMKDMRKFLDDNGGEKIKIIAKIENGQGIKNFEQILEIADGIMVARGDLGVEVPFSYIPSLQKYMLDICNKKGKIAVVATQMLESMTENPRPTRAEVSDVANAVFDGATAIMLSGESASGLYPVESVKTMTEIAVTSEESELYKNDLARKFTIDVKKSVIQTLCKAASESADFINAKGIIVLTYSGKTASKVSMYRPNVPVIAICATEQAARQCSLRYNVYPLIQPKQKFLDAIGKMQNDIVKLTNGKPGDKYIIVVGSTFSTDKTDTLAIYTLPDK